jgi:anti-sigma-K factor RskA
MPSIKEQLLGGRSCAALTVIVAAMALASGCQSRDNSVKPGPSPQATLQKTQDDIQSNPHMSPEQKAVALSHLAQAQTMKPEGSPKGHP